MSDAVTCEHCGTGGDSGGCWNRPSGTPGRASVWIDRPGRADFVLGHAGYLCTKCWWATRLSRRDGVAA